MKKKFLLAIGLICLALSLVAAGCSFLKDPSAQQPDPDPQTPEDPAAVYTVTTSFNASLGSIVLSPPAENNKYSAGSSVTAEVTPLPGRTLLSFKVDGEEKQLTDGKYTFVIGKDTSLEATFGTVPMPASVLQSLKGNTAYTGTGDEEHIYDGYETIPILYTYTFNVAFDGDLVHHFLYEERMNLYLHNWIYKNESGKAVSYARQIDNTVKRTATGEDFSRFSNPFEGMKETDFIDIGEESYLLTDPEKASAAAFALTGMEEEIERFVVFANGGAANIISIDSVKDARGEGITIDYKYNSSFVFTVADPVELDGRTEEYETKPEHASLKAALEKAAAAESYKYHVVEDDSYEYDVFVTENAIYNNEEGTELGYYLHSDNVVHEIYLEEGKLVLGDPVQGTMDGENYETTSEIAALQPIFTFAPELFEPKGNGVFAMRAEDPDLIHDVAQCIWSFGDDITMNFAQTLEITVENDTLKKVAITGKVTIFDSSFDLTYSGWDETELPLPIEGLGGTTPDTPDKPDEPETSVYPAKFIGKYEGENWSGKKYAVEITETAITVSINDTPATVTNIGYDAATGKIALTVNGTPCKISASGNPDAETVQSISLAADDYSFSAPLDRVTEGGEETETYPAKFYGTYKGTYTDFSENNFAYVLTIEEDSISITIDGVAATVEYVSYDADMEIIKITLNGKTYDIANYSSGDTVDEVNLSGPSHSDPNVNLTREGTDEGGGSDTPSAGQEKFYGTYVGETYEVTISADGITVKKDGVSMTVDNVEYANAYDITLTLDGEEYTISNASDDGANPLTDLTITKGDSYLPEDYLSRKA